MVADFEWRSEASGRFELADSVSEVPAGSCCESLVPQVVFKEHFLAMRWAVDK